MSRVTIGIFLLAIWLLMWGELSVANVVGGVVVITALFVIFPSGDHTLPKRRIHPIALAHLIAYFLGALVLANVSVARSILGRRSSIRSELLVMPLCTSDPGMLTLVTTMTALTPGSLILEVRNDPPVVRVHTFGHGDPAGVATTIRRLEELGIGALGDDAQRAALEARPPLTFERHPVERGEPRAAGGGTDGDADAEEDAS
ncbi:MAG: Na+/H+ antiporter subunit E [Propionicimonas sp.]|nr:Na+/H+ antiporter subunit E [Propionicimonas sp.]